MNIFLLILTICGAVLVAAFTLALLAIITGCVITAVKAMRKADHEEDDL